MSAAYDQVLRTQSDIQDHLPRLRDLVIDLDAKRVCELGVRAGISTIAWLEGLERTNGRLWGVDIEPAPFAHPRMQFIQSDDCNPHALAEVPDDLDIVFVDSSHLYLHTVAEIGLYVPKLATGGCMVFHDVDIERFEHHPDDEPPFPVRKAVEEAAHEMEAQVDWFTDTNAWDPDEGFNGGSCGLAVMWP